MRLTDHQRLILTELIGIRHAARGWVRADRLAREYIDGNERRMERMRAIGSAQPATAIGEIIAFLREKLMDAKFGMIQTGQAFAGLSHEVAEQLPREVWLEALSVNRSEWDTELMRHHGRDPLHIVSVLHLENSATRDDGIEARPLECCVQMALMNAIQTSETMDRAIHEAGNEFFGEAFGEYRERSPLERMGIPQAMTGGAA